MPSQNFYGFYDCELYRCVCACGSALTRNDIGKVQLITILKHFINVKALYKHFKLGKKGRKEEKEKQRGEESLVMKCLCAVHSNAHKCIINTPNK